MTAIKRSVILAPTMKSNGDPKMKARSVGRSSRNGAPIHKPKRIRRK